MIAAVPMRGTAAHRRSGLQALQLRLPAWHLRPQRHLRRLLPLPRRQHAALQGVELCFDGCSAAAGAPGCLAAAHILRTAVWHPCCWLRSAWQKLLGYE